jgi:hypothetical protein
MILWMIAAEIILEGFGFRLSAAGVGASTKALVGNTPQLTAR